MTVTLPQKKCVALLQTLRLEAVCQLHRERSGRSASRACNEPRRTFGDCHASFYRGLLVSALILSMPGAVYAQGRGAGGGTAGGNGAGQGGTGMGTPNAGGTTGSGAGASGSNTLGNPSRTPQKQMQERGNGCACLRQRN